MNEFVSAVWSNTTVTWLYADGNITTKRNQFNWDKYFPRGSTNWQLGRLPPKAQARSEEVSKVKIVIMFVFLILMSGCSPESVDRYAGSCLKACGNSGVRMVDGSHCECK
jgi:hypothetical protein